jgi:hypothetical protein
VQEPCGRGLRTFANLDFLIVDMRHHLGEIAHIDEHAAERTVAEMVQLAAFRYERPKPRLHL